MFKRYFRKRKLEKEYPIGLIEEGFIKYTESTKRSISSTLLYDGEELSLSDRVIGLLGCDYFQRSIWYEKECKNIEVQLCTDILKEKRDWLNGEVKKFSFDSYREKLYAYADSLPSDDQSRLALSYTVPLLMPDNESSALACSDGYIRNMVRYAGAFVDKGRSNEREWQRNRLLEWQELFLKDSDVQYRKAMEGKGFIIALPDITCWE